MLLCLVCRIGNGLRIGGGHQLGQDGGGQVIVGQVAAFADAVGVSTSGAKGDRGQTLGAEVVGIDGAEAGNGLGLLGAELPEHSAVFADDRCADGQLEGGVVGLGAEADGGRLAVVVFYFFGGALKGSLGGAGD